MTEKAASNSACLIGLERIGRLDLLPQLFSTFHIPPAVCSDFGATLERFTVVRDKNAALVTALKTQIDDGEAEVMALATELSDGLVILDDKKARRVAQHMGLKVIGTMGVLLRAKRQRLLTEIKPLLNALQEAGFRISAALYEESLRLAGELDG